MKKIYMILAAMTLLSMSLNAQIDATKKVAQTQQTAPTGKKVDTQLGVAKMALNPTHRAPARATETNTVTFTAGTDVASAKTITKDGVTITNTQTQTNNNSFSYSPYRLYAGTVTFTTTTGNITRIVINGTSTTNPVSRLSGTGFSVSNNVGTWNGSASSVTLTASGQARASSIVVTVETESGVETSDLTVCDGTNTNGYLPIYAYYYDNYQKNQMIYPENLLSGLAGKKITSMTFYANGNFNWSGGEVTARLATTDQTSYSSKVRLQPSDMAIVASGFDVPSSGNTWTITFTTPFEYNSGNLVIDMEETSCTSGYGHYSSSSFAFYGVTRTGGGFYSNGSTYNADFSTVYSDGSVQNFLPKVTFTYENSEPRHDLSIALSAPASIVGGNTATVTATVTNTGNQTESGYTVTFSDGTTTFSTQTGGTLAPGATETFTATYTTSAAGTVTITANVACTDDSDATNDEATTTLTVNAPIHDLGITLSAPAEVVGGNAATVTATVTNNGDYTETGYTVTINAAGTPISTPTAVSLAPGASTTFTIDYATTEAQVGTTVNFTATVACTGDADATNNSATASTAVITLPPPENVVATPDNNNMSATVTWDPPIIDPVIETVTEDFEDTSVFPTFTTGGVNANSRTGAFGNWTLYEGTGLNCYGSNDVDFGTDVEQTCYAWMPFDLTATTPAWTVTNISARSGQQFMNSMGASGGSTTDHWLISPELSGNAQTITFYDAEMKTDWGAETYEVLYSTTDNNYTSFTSLGTYSADALTWDAESANLPADAKYFAIRHTSADIFGLMIDDVTYEAKLPGLQPISYNVYLDGVLEGNVAADAALTYNFSNLASGGHTASVSAVYPGGIESAAVPAEFTILPTPNAPTVSSNDGTTSTTITITPDANTDGQLVYYVDYNGSQTQDLTFSRGANDYTVEVHAYTTATSNYNQSPEAVVPVTIPALPKTDMPVITSEQVGDYLVITATGNGIVTLNIPGYPEAQGNGSASISVPCGVVSSTVTATATAQEDGKQKSDPREQTITIPAGEGWIEMTGTYENDDDLLSLEVKVGNDIIDIMMVDQFVASTYSNEHSDGYTYTMQETVNDVDWFSNPAPIPVFKTSSTLQGLYTQTQVDNDTLMQYRANVLNTEIDYTVKPDPLVMYYDLYRGGKNEVYPVVDPGTEISRLQQFSDEANAQYFYYETHQSGIAPRYDHVGKQLVERIDTSYVNGTVGDKIAYVPVIWVPGLSTARGDGKNNSYGSDIKYNELGGVNISVEGWKNDENNTTGQWDSNGMTYCVYSPIITLNGITPEIVEAHDGETYQYVPYMYRVWCTYPSAHNFTFVANNDGSGRKHLVDAGPIEAPFLIGEATAEDSVWHNNGEEVVFGRALASGEVQQPWSFGVPKTEDSQNVKFIARFYYKKIVTPATQANGLRGNRDGEEAFAIAENGGDGHGILTGIDELWNNVVYVVSKTYVNAQGMQSDKPFDGLNIVVTRFSDGTTTTTKVVR